MHHHLHQLKSYWICPLPIGFPFHSNSNRQRTDKTDKPRYYAGAGSPGDGIVIPAYYYHLSMGAVLAVDQVDRSVIICVVRVASTGVALKVSISNIEIAYVLFSSPLLFPLSLSLDSLIICCCSGRVPVLPCIALLAHLKFHCEIIIIIIIVNSTHN